MRLILDAVKNAALKTLRLLGFLIPQKVWPFPRDVPGKTAVWKDRRQKVWVLQLLRATCLMAKCGGERRYRVPGLLPVRRVLP